MPRPEIPPLVKQAILGGRGVGKRAKAAPVGATGHSNAGTRRVRVLSCMSSTHIIEDWPAATPA